MSDRRIDGVRREQAARVAGGAIELDLLERDHQHVARLGAFDEERPGLRIGPLRDLLAVPVHAARHPIVLVTMRSPGLIRSAGGCANENVL